MIFCSINALNMDLLKKPLEIKLFSGNNRDYSVTVKLI